MLFSEIIGQSESKNKLLSMATSGRISHALMLLAPEGAGALPLSIAFARYINCTNKSENDACSNCPSCNKIKKLVHPDLHFVFPVATTKEIDKDPVSDNFILQFRKVFLQNPWMNLAEWFENIGIENKQGNISINESKEILRKLSLKAFESEYKIMIIWMPEKLNTQAANKLLKLLEEPPEKTIFILVSQDTSQILPTILSRTQLIKIPKILNTELKEALISRYGILNSEEIESIAEYANGNYLKALEVVNTGENKTFNFNAFVNLMRICYGIKISQLNDWVEEIYLIGREKQKQFLEYTLKMIRGNYMTHIQQRQLIQFTKEEAEFSVKFSKFINSKNIELLTSEFNQAHSHIEYNGNAKIIFFHLGLRLVKLLKA